MSDGRRLLKIVKTISLVLALGASMSACSRAESWKEEALQQDGSKVIVDRAVEYGGRHELGQSPPFKEQTLSFTLPKTGERVVWEDPYSDDVGSANFVPMLVEIYGDTAFILASPDGEIAESKWGCPNPPYVLFRYRNKAWTRVPLEELPTEVKSPNLVLSTPDEIAKKVRNGVVSAEIVKERNSGEILPQYKTIIRHAPPAGPCLVPLAGGGWGSPGGHVAPVQSQTPANSNK